MASTPFVAIGAFTAAQARTLAEVSAASGRSIELVDLLEDPSAWKGSGAIAGLLVDGSAPSASQVMLACRSDAEYAALPLLVLTPEVSDLGFTEAFNWGADDTVSLQGAHGLVRRLRGLPEEAPHLPSPRRGQIVVGYPDHARRIIAGRVLRNAGYSITFAVTADEASAHAEGDSACMILLDSSLTNDARGMIEKSRTRGSSTNWVIGSTPRELGRLRQSLTGLENVVAIDGYGPPENILFSYNELRNTTRANQRSSPRLLYGTTVGFRPEGYDEDDHGFTYNVSEGGFYVRTMAPPEQTTVWLELTPPRTERRVRLVGEVAWRCAFQRSAQATVPSGFGVRIIDGAKRDLDAWRAGCAAFAEAFA